MKWKQILAILGFIIVLISIPVTLYLVRQTQIFKPKAAFIPKVEFVDATGQVITETTDPNIKLRITKEQVGSTPSPSPTVSPSPTAVATIDTLDYFLTDHPEQALKPVNDHQISQTVEGNKSYYNKWAANSFEVHRWDETFIYLFEDHSNQDYGNGAKAYSWTNGRWLKRQMKVEDVINVTDNKIQYYDGDACNKIGPLSDYPYQMTLESHIPDLDLGGDLGKQDVIVVKYDYTLTDPNGGYERFYYSKEWGWVKWELWNKTKSTPDSTVLFNKRLDLVVPPIQPDRSVACTTPS